MQARSALFDLYGDYLRPRGGRAPVAALVRLLAPLDIAAPAVRTAVSRMVRQGWLMPVRMGDSPGYHLSVKAVHRLDEAAARIYRTGRPGWDGRLDLLILSVPTSRVRRARLTATLAYLGYGCVDASTWISPRPAEELDAALAEAGIRYERFSANHAAGADGTAALMRRAWDLVSLGHAYERFVADLTPTVGAIGPDSEGHAAFAARFRLVHAWRTFLFRDPQLPATLMSVVCQPGPWAGDAAAAFFDQHEARLRPAADRFVDSCLSTTKGPS
jgi:phenylacetic acid degradation operon negative regulatory protein